MKPLLRIHFSHKITDAAGNYAYIWAVFEGKFPTNIAPDNDKHTVCVGIVSSEEYPDDLTFVSICHFIRKGMLVQEINFKFEIDIGHTGEEGTLAELTRKELDWINTEIVPRVERQGFKVVLAPNTERSSIQLPRPVSRRRQIRKS